MALDTKYAVWISDPLGVRLGLFNKFLFMNYQRYVNGRGFISIAFPYKEFREQLFPYFQVDRRIEVYRSPVPGGRKRLEDVYWMRRFKIYSRKEDGMQLIEFVGRNPVSLLDRRTTYPVSGFSYSSKNTYGDDFMKAVVRENLGSLAVDENGNYDANRDLTLTNQFSVDPDVSLGPVISKEMPRRNVLELIKELSNATAEKGTQIYFDVVPTSPTNFVFKTFVSLRGVDRSNTIVPFSEARGNLVEPYYEEDYFDEKNFGYGGGEGVNSSRIITTAQNSDSINASPWARAEMFVNAPNSTTTTQVQDDIQAALDKNKANKLFVGTFLSTEGGSGKPRSLYGLDWDLGDRVPVDYADKNLYTDIKSIFVSVNGQGKENVTARNVIGV